MKTLYIISLIFILLLFLISCGTNTQGTLLGKREDNRPKVGLLLDNFNVERWYKDRDYFVEKSNELGINVCVEVANNDANVQLEQAKKMIEDGVRVLVVVATDNYAASEIVDLAHSSNVKVLAYERLIMNSNVDYYIAYDNSMIGEYKATYTTKQKPNGKYMVLCGPNSDFNASLYEKGLKRVLDPMVESQKVKLVHYTHLGERTEMESIQAMEEYLFDHKNPVPDVVFTDNDDMASGVIQTLDKFGLAGKVLVTGQDADLVGIRNILSGDQAITVYRPIKPLAFKAAEIAMQMAKDEEVTTNASLNNNKTDVKTIFLEKKPILITKDNIQTTVIADGFLEEAEVYN